MAKVINKKEFMKLKAGTIYREWEPIIMGEICIKDDNTSNNADFFMKDLGSIQYLEDSDVYVDALLKIDNGECFRFDYETVGRDAMFKDDQLYIVYDNQDIKDLIDVLQNSIGEEE